MMQVLSQLLSAALGSVGFGLIFNLNRRYLPAAAVGGFLAWLAYLLADHALSSAFLANLLAGFCLIDFNLGADYNFTAAGSKGIFNTFDSLYDTAGWKIWALNVFHQFI